MVEFFLGRFVVAGPITQVELVDNPPAFSAVIFAKGG